mmetsp:Transcript_12332/g.18691  ORF Transcript_12332/g.18691 Transcript_12332/m.18691 type:complete len:206 (-) Transcript_12332:2016-2633(-)
MAKPSDSYSVFFPVARIGSSIASSYALCEKGTVVMETGASEWTEITHPLEPIRLRSSSYPNAHKSLISAFSLSSLSRPGRIPYCSPDKSALLNPASVSPASVNSKFCTTTFAFFRYSLGVIPGCVALRNLTTSLLDSPSSISILRRSNTSPMQLSPARVKAVPDSFNSLTGVGAVSLSSCKNFAPVVQGTITYFSPLRRLAVQNA